MLKSIAILLAALVASPSLAADAPGPAKADVALESRPLPADRLFQVLVAVEAQELADAAKAKRRVPGPADAVGPLAVTPLGAKAACKAYEVATGERAVKQVGFKNVQEMTVGRGGKMTTRRVQVFGPRWSAKDADNLRDARELLTDWLRAAPSDKGLHDAAATIKAWKIANGHTPKQAEDFAAKALIDAAKRFPK
jgi:hypothetical protein